MLRRIALCLVIILPGLTSSPAAHSICKLDDDVSSRLDSLTARSPLCDTDKKTMVIVRMNYQEIARIEVIYESHY